MQWIRYFVSINWIFFPKIISSLNIAKYTEIEKIAKKEPAELIIKILEQGNDGCMNTRDIERILGYMFGAAKAKRWWTATKKVLIKDPRIAVPNKKNEPYVLRDEPVKPEQEILQDFFEEKRSYEKDCISRKTI